MKISISTVRPALPHEWDQIWRQCDYSTYFHSPEWAEIWNAYTKGATRPSPSLITFSDGNKALLPLSLQTLYKGVVRRYLSSPAGTFGGWISSDELGLEHAALLADYLAKRLGNVYWRLNPYDPLVFKVPIRTGQDDETHALSLASGFDAIYRGWTKGHASAARKARREGVTVKQASTLDDWRAYYQTYEDSVQRWGEKASAKYAWEMFSQIFRLSSPHTKLWLAVYQNKVIAGALCFYAPRHVVYWHGAALEDYFRLRPANLLMSEAIRDACEKGYCWFDFNPSGGHEGVKAFKRSFGASSLPSPVIHREGKTLRILTLTFRMARRFRP